MESATVRIRPLRLAFLVKPTDKAALKRVFAINSGIWGGLYNFIVPYFKKLPKVYHQPYMKKQLPAATVMDGMLDGIQPDYLVEMEQGMAAGLRFRRPALSRLMNSSSGRRTARSMALICDSSASRRADAAFLLAVPLRRQLHETAEKIECDQAVHPFGW